MPATLTIGKLIAAIERRGYLVTAPTLRYWEARGLIEPGRTASGYREYDAGDVERVETVCRLQSEHHMPLAAIADYLGELDRGLEPAPPSDVAAQPPHIDVRGEVPGIGSDEADDDLSLTADELARAAGIDEDFLASMQSYGLLGDTEYYCRNDARIAAAARVLATQGIEPRHLRPFHAAAERELALVDAVMAPAARSAGDTDAAARELARACGQLHAALLMAKLPGRY